MSFNSSKLSNGLNVVTYSMPHVNSVSVNVIVTVGSRHETLEESGISHFLEHMAFKGTKERSAIDIAKEFDSIGGHFNAYTSREQTVYYTKVLNTHTKQALDILADILLNSTFNEEDIKKEFGVISQEIASGNDSPDDLAHEKFYELAYGEHPLGRSILGTKENIAQFNKASFQQYMAKHYNASNVFISMAGKIEHDEAIDLAEQFFAKLPESKPESYVPAKYIGGYAFKEKELEQTTIILGFESVSYKNTEEFYHVQILSIILGGGLSSRLFQKIREDLGLAYSVGSWASAFSDSGIFSIGASADHADVAVLLENIIMEINKIKNHINDEELVRAKAQIESNIYMAEEKSEYKSEEIGKNFALFGQYYSPQEVMKIVNATTISDLLSSAKKVFSSSPTLSVVGTAPKDFDFEKLKKELLTD
ncbi:MAG: pitrilysin family protein [Rickettsiaceae bacterium]|nr:pitrilysin family protein [Rickettsiaceae bacterium]